MYFSAVYTLERMNHYDSCEKVSEVMSVPPIIIVIDYKFILY